MSDFKKVEKGTWKKNIPNPVLSREVDFLHDANTSIDMEVKK